MGSGSCKRMASIILVHACEQHCNL